MNLTCITPGRGCHFYQKNGFIDRFYKIINNNNSKCIITEVGNTLQFIIYAQLYNILTATGVHCPVINVFVSRLYVYVGAATAA